MLQSHQDIICAKEGLVGAWTNQGSQNSWNLFGGQFTLRRGEAGSWEHIGRRVQTTKSKNGIDVDGSIPISIEDLLKYYPTSPPDAFINVKEFYLNPYRISMTWCNTIRDWDVFDFNTYYHISGVRPYFNAYSRRYLLQILYIIREKIL